MARKHLPRTPERQAEVKRLRALASHHRRVAAAQRRRVDLTAEKDAMILAGAFDQKADVLEISMGITPLAGAHAYCYRTGRIYIGKTVPKGALPLARGPASVLRDTVIATSRHGYREGVYLVSGVPEARNDDEALEAVKRFSAWAFTRPNLNPAFTKAMLEAEA